MTDAQPTAPEPTAPPARPRGRKRRFAWRWTRRLSLVAAGWVAAFVISFLSIDLGRVPGLTAVAEREASRFLERRAHIGRIRAYLWPGKFAVEGLRIEGRTADAAPFFAARRITIEVPWWTLFRKELVVQVELDDWEMVVETWAGGVHNIPRLTPRSRAPEGPRRLTTTVPYVHARSGRFTYHDHVAPWSVVAPNLNFSLVRAAPLKAYVGVARFTGGTVRIQDFLPMQADLSTRFTLDGPLVRLQHIDLQTDGAMSHINGTVGFGDLWPNQQYHIDSTVDFPRMRQIFFAQEDWALDGQGRFKGIFRIVKDGPFNLSGSFSSDELRFDRWRFPDLDGALEWTPSRFAVTHADSRFEQGTLRLAYALAPLGTKQGATATLSADFEDVDLHGFTRQLGWQVLEPDGRLRGDLAVTWPNGRFGTGVKGQGKAIITAPAGSRLAQATLPEGATAPPLSSQDAADVPIGRVPFGGDVTYQFDAGALSFSPSWAATADTYVTFNGKALGGPTAMAFHVTSHDWQGSDRLFVAIMNQFSATPTGAIEVSGRGTFDGALTESFRDPKIAGRFAGDGMGAWKVRWGRAAGDIVMEKGFMDITNGEISNGAGGTIRTTGRYALGYRGGEEIRATVAVSDWPLEDFRRAFDLEDWPVEGTVQSADLTLRGPYREPTGGGPMRLVDGRAWGESFERAGGGLVFEGRGLRIRDITMAKGQGRIEAEAFLDWHEGTYVFDAATPPDGRIPVETLDTFKFDPAPLTGRLQFKAHGQGAFDDPSYEVDGRIADLYAGDEGVGEVRARLVVRERMLTIASLDAVSGRLTAFGSGSIALNEHLDARLFLRFDNTSLDPYLRLVAPVRVSEFTRAVTSGSISVIGPLANRKDMVIEATVDDATLTLFDYDLTNDEPVSFVYEGDVFRIVRLKLQGQDTKLEVTGHVDAGQRLVDLRASGQANLAIVQLFNPDISAGGAATIGASLSGPFGKTSLTGTADITGGRLKPHALPHGFSDINGPIRVEANRLIVGGLPGDPVARRLVGVMGEGPVTFSGSVTLNDAYAIERYDLTARGQSMHLRVPRGLLSTVDAELTLTGPASAPVLAGDVDVLTASYRPPIEAVTDIFTLAAGGGAEEPPPGPAVPASGVTLLYDIDVYAPIMPFIENRQATIDGSASAHISGTFDKPIVTGSVDIERGLVTLFGNRYTIRSGSRIDFSNPQRFDPVFSIDANTRVRAQSGDASVQSQTFNVDIRVSGTLSKLTPSFSSDPWLPDFQLISLLLGESPDIGNAEISNQRSRQDLQMQALRSATATLLTSAISSRVVGVVQNPLIDTVQLTPVLGREASLQQLSPTGRLTLTKAISSQVFLTYARTFRADEQEVIRIEYDQSDRLTWVLTRNEDRTFSLDVRIRRVF